MSLISEFKSLSKLRQYHLLSMFYQKARNITSKCVAFSGGWIAQ